MTQTETLTILDATGKPARPAADARCPRCGAGPEQRVPSGGFGVPHPVCTGGCSPAYEWLDERCEERA
jgi:hypothetical protein